MIRLEKAPNGWFCPTDPGEPGVHTKRWSVNEREGRLLSALFRGLEVLEIGTGLGVSTKAIASTAKTVYTIDIDPWVEKNVVPELPDNVKFYKSAECIPPVGGAFIDGLHLKDAIMADIATAKSLVKNGGIIVFHDTNINDVLRSIMASKLMGYIVDTEVGMAVTWNDKEENNG